MHDSTEACIQVAAKSLHSLRHINAVILIAALTISCSILISGHWFYTALNSVCPDEPGTIEYQSASLVSQAL